MARQMLEQGFEHVFALKGGWWAWEEADYPMQPKDQPEGKKNP